VENQLIMDIFFPHAQEATARAQSKGGRFVYYTTAAVAFSIIKNKQIWMRNTTTMNDYMEVDYGIKCVYSAYDSIPGNMLNAAINACYPSLALEIRQLFDSWVPSFWADTFITCLSEHSIEEDNIGKLSMWRAYGGKTGVALVINGAPLFLPSDALGAYASPVAYLDQSGFAAQMQLVANNIQKHISYVKTLERDKLKNIMFNVLRFAALCTKHPGFKEELEWRIVASPALQSSDLLQQTIEIVRGVPQTILKINLQNHPEKGLVGITLPELLNRIIIGPCEFPLVTYKAFHKSLAEAEVPYLDEKIIVSNIPLRHSNY